MVMCIKLSTIFCLLFLLACQSGDHSTVSFANDQDGSWPSGQLDSTKFYFPYNFKIVDIHQLSSDLIEISGLGLATDGESLIAVNDEEGKVFFLDKNNGEIIREIYFGQPGDYEGIEMVGDLIYVLRSDGAIFEIDERDGESRPEVQEYEILLDEDHNVEGFAYDAARHRLLLACKKNTVEGKASKEVKAIYAFDLSNKQISESPVFTINRKDVLFGKEAIIEDWWQEALNKSFGPSGLAVDPGSENIYLLSSPGKLVVVLNPSGEVIHIQKLDKKDFKQPEGICFGKDGTLYITSEGNAKKRIKGELAILPTMKIGHK